MARSRDRTAPPQSPGGGGRATRPSSTRAPALVRISDLATLAGVPAATIKHYMREGLLPRPTTRTGRTMAYYDPRLAARVQTIKDLQARRFLPLKLIAELLEPPPSAALRADADDTLRRHLGDLEPAIRAGAVDARQRRERDAERRESRASLLARLDISAAELDHLARVGLCEPTLGPDGEAIYGGADLEILEVLDDSRRNGLGALFPLSVLEPYVAAVRTLVRVEIELFRRRVLSGDVLPPRPLDEIAREGTRLGERILVALRAKLIIPELRAAAGAPRRRK